MHESEPKPEWRAPTVGEPVEAQPSGWLRSVYSEHYKASLSDALLGLGAMSEQMRGIVDNDGKAEDFVLFADHFNRFLGQANSSLDCLIEVATSQGTA